MAFIGICYHNVGFKVFGGVPPIGIGVESVAVREARKGLRKAMPNDFHTEAKDKPTLNPDEPKTVGGIKQMFQGMFLNI